MTSYWIAIEGGGTRSRLSLVNKQLEEYGQFEGPPLHAQRLSLDTLGKRCKQLITRAHQNCEISGDSIKGLALALAGADRTDDQKPIRKALQSIYPEWTIYVTSDVRATHTGAFNNKPGILVIAGTGSIVLGKNESRWRRAGGYGYRMGDEGSGHLIGTEGLRAAGRDYDGQQSTQLTTLLEQELNIASREALIQWTYDADHTPSRIAPYVIRCAEEGDPVCQSILRRQIGQLIQLIQTLITDLNLEKAPLSYYGGLFDSPYYVSRFRQALEEKLEEIHFQSPKYNPRIGVCLMTGDF